MTNLLRSIKKFFVLESDIQAFRECASGCLIAIVFGTIFGITLAGLVYIITCALSK